MTHSDLQWLAGWLEGEGSFSFRRQVAKETGYINNQWSISATSIDLDVLEKVAGLLKVNICRQGKPTTGGNAYWQLRLSRRDEVLKLCHKLRPLMQSRRQGQIDKLLKADEDYPKRHIGWPKGKARK